jgi:hypothetical protein
MNTRRKQRGDSMIGMIVGLALSIFTAIAMLSAYRTMVGISIPATRIAKREGQAATALLTAQTEVQQAGFGITADDAGVSVYVDSGDTPAEVNKKVVWRYRETLGGGIKCAGLLLRATAGDNDGIYFLSPVDCGSADEGAAFPDLQSLATSSVLFEPDDSDESASYARSYNLATSEFELIDSPKCGPYGVPGFHDGAKILQLKDTGTNAVVFSQCLSNL